MNNSSLSVLIPAAGASTRLGRAKQLAKKDGVPLIQHMVNLCSSIAPREVVVVTGANAAAIRSAVAHPLLRIVDHPDWSSGIGGSISAGVRAVDPGSTGVMIVLCDQWRLEGGDLRVLAESWRQQPDRIVCADAGGVSMPPVIFPASYLEQLRNLKGDVGARSLLRSNRDLVLPVPMENAAFDLDTPDQLDYFG